MSCASDQNTRCVSPWQSPHESGWALEHKPVGANRLGCFEGRLTQHPLDEWRTFPDSRCPDHARPSNSLPGGMEDSAFGGCLGPVLKDLEARGYVRCRNGCGEEGCAQPRSAAAAATRTQSVTPLSKFQALRSAERDDLRCCCVSHKATRISIRPHALQGWQALVAIRKRQCTAASFRSPPPIQQRHSLTQNTNAQVFKSNAPDRSFVKQPAPEHPYEPRHQNSPTNLFANELLLFSEVSIAKP